MHRSLAQSRLWVLVVVGSAWVAAPIAAQDTYTWNSSGSSATATAWLVPSNWTQNPNDVPPTPSTHFAGRVNAPNTGNSFNTDDVAYFGSTLPSNTPTAVGINMGSAGSPAILQLGAIWVGVNPKDLQIGNSSLSAAGTLRLNGASLTLGGGVQTNDVILYNNGLQALTIQNTVVTSGQSMGLVIAPSNAIIHANPAATINISSLISETASGNGITFSGGGTLILAAANGNAYTGGTTVSGGTLRAMNTSGSATGSGPVTVAAGATLSGTGTIIPNTGVTANNTVAVSGTLKPGTDSTPGTLSIGSATANASVSVTDTYSWSLSSSGPSASTPGGSDAAGQSRLVVAGDLILTPSSINIVGLNVADFDNSRPYSWRVATATGSITVGSSQPTFNVTGLNAGGGSFQLSSGAGSVLVSFSPVPEPASILFLCGTAASIHWLRRRRRNSPASDIRPPSARFSPPD